MQSLYYLIWQAVNLPHTIDFFIIFNKLFYYQMIFNRCLCSEP